MEKDITIPLSKRIRFTEKWYELDSAFTAAQNIERKKVKEVLDLANVGFRNQAPEFMRMCYENKLNFSIVSGGCSDIIASMMNQVIDVKNYENFRIYGNEMVFEDDKIKRVEMKINSVGKKMIIDDQKVQNRKQIILLGDILPDVNIVQNVSYDNLIAIGFLNKPRNVH